MTNQPNWVAFTSADGSVNYVKAENNNYEDIRGIELTMSKGHGTWWSGFVNYTYQVESEGYFGLRHHYQDPQKQRDYILRYPPAQVKPLPRPYFRLNLVLHSPARFGPKVLDRHPLGNWQASFLGNWKAGQYSTWNPNEIPGLSANVRWVDSVNVDLRFSKSIQLRGSEFEIFADIENLLDTKYLSYAGFSGIRDFESYMYSLNFDFEEGVEKGNDRIGTYRPDDVDYDPLEANPYDDPDIAAANKRRKETKSYIDNPDIRSMTFLDPRKINIGIRLNF